jgi:hypothetical protein
MKDDKDDPKKVPAVPEHDFFEDYASGIAGGNIVGDLLKFQKGEYVAGRENASVAKGTKLVVHMTTLMAGWIRWEAGRPTNQKMVKIADDVKPLRREELGDTDKSLWPESDDPWSFSNNLVMSNPETGELFTFPTGSKGGIGAVGELCKAYSEHNRQKPGEYLIIKLLSGGYMHPDRTIGFVHTPRFEIIGWVPREGPDRLLSGSGGDDEPPPQLPPAAAPAKTKKTAPASPRM